jgi:hypothetical protein
MPRWNEGPQSHASEGSVHDYTSEGEEEDTRLPPITRKRDTDETSEEQEEYTRLPPITRERDANAKATMIELLHRLKDLIEHNVT